MSSPPGGWTSLNITGQAPPPCANFTLTTIGEKRAALYGGDDESYHFDHLFIVELGRHSVVSVEVCVHNYPKLHVVAALLWYLIWVSLSEPHTGELVEFSCVFVPYALILALIHNS